MNAQQKRSQKSPIEEAIYEVTLKPFSVAGHLWVICYFAGYLDARKLEDRAENATRRAILSATKGYLDDVFDGRSGSQYLSILRELKSFSSDSPVTPVLELIAHIGDRIGRAKQGGDARPVTRSRISRAFRHIEAELDQRQVKRWHRNSSTAFDELVERLASEGLRPVQSGVETVDDALVQDSYARAWLLERNDRGSSAADGEETPVVSICRHLESTEFSLEEMLAIHDRFSECVKNLPSVDVNAAAEMIGVTVDRVHRMAALGEIDSFFIRRRIPKAEVKLKKKGQKRKADEKTAEYSDTAKQLITCFQETTFTIPNLLEIQAVLGRRINRASFPLKTAVERLGYSEVHVHLMLRQGKLRSFGLPRLFPESEALRLQRDPNVRHLGRPRISEQE